MKAFQNNENEGLISEINVTPLVDVMLILMIIFLITAPLLVKNLGVELPSAKAQQQVKVKSKTISIKSDGSFLLDGSKISEENLELSLKNINDKKLVIKIAADKNSKYQDVATILSILGRQEISNVGFLTKE